MPRHAGAGREGDAQARLPGLDREGHRLLVHEGGRERDEVAAVELAVAGDARVRHAAVEAAHQLEPARPVLGHDGELDRGEVRLAQVDEAPALEERAPPGAVAQAHAARQDPPPQVELLSVLEHLQVRRGEPVPARGPRAEAQPVGEVDEVLVLDRSARDLGDQPVVAPGHVGAGVAGSVGLGLLPRAARREEAVAQRAQRFAQALPGGVPALVDERPAAHGALASWARRVSRKTSTSPGSASA